MGISGTVIVAAGGGGSPTRHQRLIVRLEAAGLAVIAPEFARLAGPRASLDEMLGRIALFRQAFAQADPALPLYGVGHSLGGALLIGFAGCEMWLGPGARLPVEREPRLASVAALAPPVEFFGAPGAAEALAVPLLLRSAGQDDITPAATHEAFIRRLAAPVDFAIDPQAGHFSFMDQPPPGVEPTFADEAAIRERTYTEILAFLAP